MTENNYFDIFGFLKFAKLLTKREIACKLWETLEENIEITCPIAEQAGSIELLNRFINAYTMVQNYLDSIHKQFAYYKMLGDKTFAQLNEEDLFWQYNPESNSIAIIVKHLWGNMRSRWTDFLTTDGEKEWRHRDTEFEADIKSKEELLEKWEEGWDCLFTALASVNQNNFDTVIYIRNMGHTITEAINRQLAHYAYHIGQIVFIGRIIKGKTWESLSIPKGKSAAFNAKKFAQPKRREHFTQEFLENKENKTD